MSRGLLTAVLTSEAAPAEALQALRLAELLVLLQELVLVINKQLKIKSQELPE